MRGDERQAAVTARQGAHQYPSSHRYGDLKSSDYPAALLGSTAELPHPDVMRAFEDVRSVETRMTETSARGRGALLFCRGSSVPPHRDFLPGSMR